MDLVGIPVTILFLSIIFPPGYPRVTVKTQSSAVQRVCDTKPSIPEPSHYRHTGSFPGLRVFRPSHKRVPADTHETPVNASRSHPEPRFMVNMNGGVTRAIPQEV